MGGIVCENSQFAPALGISSSHTHRVKNAALPGRIPNKKPKAVIPLVNNIKIDVFNL
jgi:hypothetical protein